MKDKKNLAMLGLIILSIVLISVTIFVLNKEQQVVVEEVEKIKEVYVGVEKGEILDNFTREDAVNKLIELLKSVESDPQEEESEDTVLTRLERLDNEDTDIEDILTQETMDMIYFPKDFKEVKFNRQFTASSMLIYYEIVRDGNEEKSFEPVIQMYDDIVYLDYELMTAHIPLDIFVGSGTGIAFEMQYMNGEWKLNPYTAMMSLNLMGILNQQD